MCWACRVPIRKNPEDIARAGAFSLRTVVNCDSVSLDEGFGQMHRPPREHVKQGLALLLLVVLTVSAIAGPTGLLAWAENSDALEQRKARIAVLKAQRDALGNRVELLDPQGADPDLVSELVRKDLGVLHPDEIVITLEDK
jgi:cell division protein FtsB